MRMALLDKLDHNPDFLGRDAELASVLAPLTSPKESTSQQNFAVTGLMIVAIGIGCILFGRILRVGDLAVGTFLGGWVCLLVGTVLALLGAVVKVLSRDPTKRLANK